MTKLNKVIILLSMLAISTGVGAQEYQPMQGKYLWSLGFDVKYTNARPVGEYKKLFAPNKIGSTVYVASRFNSPMGFEIGYSWSDPSAKGFDAPTGTTAFGTTATASQVHNARYRFKDTYFDLQAHVPMTKNVEAKLAVGVGFVRQGLVFAHHPGNGADNMQTTLDRLKGKTCITARFGIGAQALITERVGIRLMLNYQTLSNIKLRGTQPDVSNRPFANSYSAALGLYFTLTAYRERATY